MRRCILAFLTFLFLVVLAPVLAFSMLAPWAMQKILLWWSVIAVAGTLVGGSVSLWAYMESKP